MDLSELTIRRLAPDEWEKFKAIRLEALRLEPDAFGSTYEDARQHPDQVWKDRLAANLYLFAVAVEPVGIVGAYRDAGVMRIISMYVAADWRRNGVGRQLMEAILAEIPDREVVLGVFPGQREAIALYESLGFRFLPALCGGVQREMILER